MKSKKYTLIALAIGWYVLLDILLRTSGQAISSVYSSVPNNFFRVIAAGPNGNPTLFSISILALVVVLWLSFLILLYLTRVWTYTIRLTRTLIKYLFYDNYRTEEEEKEAEVSFLHDIFGKDVMKSRDALFWLSLHTLLTLWIIMIIITVVTTLINALGY